MENLSLVSSPKLVLGLTPRNQLLSCKPFVGLIIRNGRETKPTSSLSVRYFFQPPKATKTIEKVARDCFASLSKSSGQQTSSVGVNPPISVPPSSQVGSPLFWIGVGVGLSALLSWVADRAKSSKAVGQILEKFQGKEWKEKQIRLISDRAFNRVKDNDGRAKLSFEELYIAVLLVYNDLNKRLPGPHFDPPTKDQVKSLMKECDINLDGELDREEFVKFIRKITKDTFISVSQGLIITLAIAPTVALLTKRSTENVPGIGKVVQKIPTSIYASLVTLAIVAFQQGAERS